MSIIDLVNSSLRPEVNRMVMQTAVRDEISTPDDVMAELEGTESPQDARVSTRAEALLQNTQIDNAVSTLTGYVPTESITLYIAALAIVPALSTLSAIITQETIYWFFTLLTPILFFLIYVAKRRTAGLPRMPQSLREYPWWGMIAATIAFLAWAVAVPESPYLTTNEGRLVAGFLALLISTILSRLEPVFGPQKASPE